MTTNTDHDWYVKDASDARDKIGLLWTVGLLLLVVGAIVAGMNVPGEELDVLGNVESTGSVEWFSGGLLVAGIGQLLVAVGIIATGVQLGNRSIRG